MQGFDRVRWRRGRPDSQHRGRVIIISTPWIRLYDKAWAPFVLMNQGACVQLCERLSDRNLFIFRKTLVVQLSNKVSEEQKCKYYIPVCLKEVMSGTIVKIAIQKICQLFFCACIQYYSFIVFIYHCITTKLSQQDIVANRRFLNI